MAIGYFLSLIYQRYLAHSTGVIFARKEGEKLVYSMILDDDPDSIRFKKHVRFKVDAPEELSRK